jgi:hypothetical protein
MRASALSELVRLFIGQRLLPSFGHLELSAHCAQRGRPTAANGDQLRDRLPVSLDHDVLAILDKVEKLRQLCLGAVHADVHADILAFLNQRQMPRPDRISEQT